jgi:hypothetical protein
VPRCEPANHYYKTHPKTCDPNQMGFCGVDKRAYPEEFWNCADVSIIKKGEPLPKHAVHMPYPDGTITSVKSSAESNMWVDEQGMPRYHDKK